MKYNELTTAIKSPVFSRTDLVLSGYEILDYQLSLWVKKGYLIRLKNGLYAFRREMEKVRGEGVAFLLCQPSYLSLETFEFLNFSKFACNKYNGLRSVFD